MAINTVEWSGILFYSIKGGIEDPSKMKIIIEDILPMDKGNTSFTKYDFDERFEDYLMENPKHMDYYVGHVHSHHNMGVFFSGTDNAELVENSGAHNFYLSLIVNNHGDRIAKVAFRGTVEFESEIMQYAKNEKGEDYPIAKRMVQLKEEEVYVYDTVIKSKTKAVKVPKTFAEKVKALLKPVQNAVGGKSWQNNNNYRGSNAGFTTPQRKTPGPGTKKAHSFVDKYAGPNFPGTTKLPPVEDDDPYDVAENFLLMVLCAAANLTNVPNTIDKTVEIISTTRSYTPMEFAKRVIAVTPKTYEEMFPDATEEEFLADILIGNDVLREYGAIFPELENTIDAIDALIQNLIQNER